MDGIGKMSVRPFYRWKSFWLGLCVLAFLGWAWARSTYLVDGVRVMWGVKCYTVQWCDDVVSVVELDMSAVPERHPFRAFGYSILLRPTDLGVQERWALASRGDGGATRIVTWVAFPLSVAFVGFLVVWAGWLFWHGRRRVGGLTVFEMEER